MRTATDEPLWTTTDREAALARLLGLGGRPACRAGHGVPVSTLVFFGTLLMAVLLGAVSLLGLIQ